MDKMKVALKVAPFVGAAVVLGGIFLWLGVAQTFAVLSIFAFIFGWWLGATKGKNVKKRLEG